MTLLSKWPPAVPMMYVRDDDIGDGIVYLGATTHHEREIEVSVGPGQLLTVFAIVLYAIKQTEQTEQAMTLYRVLMGD